MILRKALMSMALGTYALGATVANAAPAIERTSASTEEELGMGGSGMFGWVLALAIAAGVVLIIVSDDDDLPTSP